ncbi:MAG: hypothetical protein K6T59_17125 [Bryobacteraceae bacterium]|nr:hypothetical protein [Bryobacteraceae bacterium]
MPDRSEVAVWQRLPACFELLSPAHVGFLPNRPGTVIAPTRPYVLGKNLWGAVTASLAPRLFAAPTPRDFAVTGNEVRDTLAFSYFYLSDGEQIFIPSYDKGGLRWAGVPDQEFRARFLDSRLATKISEMGGAEEASLHEIEFIRHRIGSPTTGATPVLLCGVVWVHSGSVMAARRLSIDGGRLLLQPGGSDQIELDLLDGITVGGERNYGFGRIRLVPVSPVIKRQLEALWPDEPGTPFRLNRPLLGHAPYRPDIPFRGQIEIVASREYPGGRERSYEAPGAVVSTSGHFFAPGTCLLTGEYEATIDSFGQVSLLPVCN